MDGDERRDGQLREKRDGAAAGQPGGVLVAPGLGVAGPVVGADLPGSEALWPRRVRAVLSGAVLLALAAANVAGFSYYISSSAVRMHHPLRPYFKSSGFVGQSLGLLALALFLFIWLYPIRKKVRWLAHTGALARWLDFHIAAGLLAPLIAATHASWRFTGLIGLAYAAMLVVVLSGVIGRYLYSRIPRRRNGVEMTRDEIGGERRRLLGELSEATDLTPGEIEDILAVRPASERASAFRAVARMVADDRGRRRAVRALVRRIAKQGRGAGSVDSRTLRRVARLARREMALNQQLRMLDALQRVFRLWHAAHRPVAITVLLAVVIHVSVAVAVGQTWFW